MINKLITLFRGSKSKEVARDSFPYSKSNYICFIIDPQNNEPIIRINVADLTDEGCSKYAELIFNMNFGIYQKNIGSILQSLSKQDPDIEAFVQNLTINLDMLLQDMRAEKEKLDTCDRVDLNPVIRPTHFQQNNVK